MLDGVCEPAVAIATELELCDASIFIGKYEFAGPFDKPGDIAEERGVFAVLCYHDREYELLDIGFADNLRKALMEHPDHDDWLDNCTGTLAAAVYYEPQMSEDEAIVLIDSIERELSQNEI